MAAIHGGFEYVPNSTRVDSPIDDALASRRGVCQDFTHLMLAALRHLGLPCRYVSGYIAPRIMAGRAGSDRASPRTPGSRCCCRSSGGSGFDPTHNMEAGLPSRARGHRARLCGRAAHSRHVQGQDREHAGGVGGSDAGRSPAHARPGRAARARGVSKRRLPRMTTATGSSSSSSSSSSSIEARLGLASLGRARPHFVRRAVLRTVGTSPTRRRRAIRPYRAARAARPISVCPLVKRSAAGPSLGSMALELSEPVFVASMVAWTLASAGVLHRLSWPADHPRLQLGVSPGDHRGQLLIPCSASPAQAVRPRALPRCLVAGCVLECDQHAGLRGRAIRVARVSDSSRSVGLRPAVGCRQDGEALHDSIGKGRYRGRDRLKST